MFIDPRRNRPSGPMSPVPPTPMDLANNPMAAAAQPGPAGGALDPRISEAYDRYLEAGQGSIDQMRGTQPEKPSVARSILQALPAVAMGIATGGAAIPAALAYASASGMADYSGDKAAQKEWELKRADAIAAQRKSEFEAAESAFGPNGSAKATDGRALMQKEFEWVQQLPEGPQRDAAWKAWQNKYSGNMDEMVRFLRDNPDATGKIAGHEATVEGATTAAQKAEQRAFDLRTARDDIEINYVPMLDETAQAASDMLAKIEADEGTFNFPIFGRFLANVIPDLAEMQQYAAGEALMNLQITNLAPVTEKELEFIQTMAADPRAWNSEVNVRRLKGTLKKLARAKEKVSRQLGYIRKELGESDPVAAPQAQPQAEAPAGNFDLEFDPETGTFK